MKYKQLYLFPFKIMKPGDKCFLRYYREGLFEVISVYKYKGIDNFNYKVVNSERIANYDEAGLIPYDE